MYSGDRREEDVALQTLSPYARASAGEGGWRADALPQGAATRRLRPRRGSPTSTSCRRSKAAAQSLLSKPGATKRCARRTGRRGRRPVRPRGWRRRRGPPPVEERIGDHRGDHQHVRAHPGAASARAPSAAAIPRHRDERNQEYDEPGHRRGERHPRATNAAAYATWARGRRLSPSRKLPRVFRMSSTSPHHERAEPADEEPVARVERAVLERGDAEARGRRCSAPTRRPSSHVGRPPGGRRRRGQ